MVLFDTFLALGTLGLVVALVVLLGVFLYSKYCGRPVPHTLVPFWHLLQTYSLHVAFLIMVGGMVGSLIYSEILGLPVCPFCWAQRALIYPQVVLLGIFVWNKTPKAFNYLMGLNLMGIVIAGYQYYNQMVPSHAIGCTLTGTDCFTPLVLKFGFITIPFMALVAFISVLVLTYIWQSSRV